MDDIFKEIEEAGDKVKKEQTIDLGMISRLVESQVMLERKANDWNVNKIISFSRTNEYSIEDLEEALKLRKKVLFNIRQVQIPEVMKEFGLDSIKTTTGTTIKIKGDISVSIKDETNFFKYLRENEAGDLIKEVIIVSVTSEERKEVIDTLDQTECVYETKEGIHAQTLKKYIKGLREKGVKVPENLVSIYEYQFSKIS